MDHLLEQITNTNQMTATINKNLLLAKSSPENGADQKISTGASASIQTCGLPAATKLSKSRLIAFSSFSGPFGRLVFKKEVRTSAFGGKDGMSAGSNYTRSESTWVFMPSFLSRNFDFRYLNNCGHIERALRTYPTIPYNHAVWRMCGQGDLKGLQKLLNDRHISPFSVDGLGNTLLHVRFSIRISSNFLES
jgi:hypothetical protein